MNNQYQLTVILKQHTPIIHFQHDDEGATLRATEVKPKLDKFIIEQLTNKHGEEARKAFKNSYNKSWQAANGRNEHYSLNYKLKVIALSDSLDEEVSGIIEYEYRDRKGNYKTEKFPGYFGSTGREQNEVPQFKMYSEVSFNVFCLEAELLSVIRGFLPTFFMHHNFGTRQSKGFGSFYLKDEIEHPVTPLSYYFDVDVSNPPESFNEYLNQQPSKKFVKLFRLFEVINLFYSTLKSGINQSWGSNPIYFKSMMFMYAKNRMGVQWDKKKIKEALFSKEYNEQKRESPDADTLTYSPSQSYLLRDILGLSTFSKWSAEYRDGIQTESASEGDHKIERFSSPIFFKPIEKPPNSFRVYFEADQHSLEGMLDKTFIISTENRQQKPLQISTPPSFNLDDFLRYAFSIEVEKHIRTKGGNGYSADGELLKSIYKQIRANSKIL